MFTNVQVNGYHGNNKMVIMGGVMVMSYVSDVMVVYNVSGVVGGMSSTRCNVIM